MSVLEQVQDDVKRAMKARDRERAGALRMIVDVLQQDAKLGKGDEVAVLERGATQRGGAGGAQETGRGGGGLRGRGPGGGGRFRAFRGRPDRGLPAAAARRRGAGR